MAIQPALLDTTTLSEVMKGRNQEVLREAGNYLAEHGRFQFSIITRYEILRGLEARGASRQLERFEDRCTESLVLPLADAVVTRAAKVYAELRRAGALISDADILIGATALVHDLPLVTENGRHFERIAGLTVKGWR